MSCGHQFLRRPRGRCVQTACPRRSAVGHGRAGQDDVSVNQNHRDLEAKCTRACCRTTRVQPEGPVPARILANTATTRGAVKARRRRQPSNARADKTCARGRAPRPSARNECNFRRARICTSDNLDRWVAVQPGKRSAADSRQTVGRIGDTRLFSIGAFPCLLSGCDRRLRQSTAGVCGDFET